MKAKEISAFFPAWNEEGNIQALIEDALAVLSELALRFEVIIILYEGSTDRTAEIVRRISKADPGVRLVIQSREERGYGAALRLGYRSARYDLVFYSDADRQFDLGELKQFIPLAERFDLVAGYRRKREGPPVRIVVWRVYNFLLRVVFGLRERDADCAFKLCRRGIFQRVSLNCRSGLADAELLLKTRLFGFRVTETPVTHLPRKSGASCFEVSGGRLISLPPPGVIWKIIKEMISLRRELAALKTTSLRSF
jgi:glycosyltransferase involved in cell wall biosynthesis